MKCILKTWTVYHKINKLLVKGTSHNIIYLCYCYIHAVLYILMLYGKNK